MRKLILKLEDFVNYESQAVMASGGGTRLWSSVRNGEVKYLVENLRDDGRIVCRTADLQNAIEYFNKTN